MQRLLNLGCGSRYRVDPEWTNVDFQGQPETVIEHNLTTGIPFPDCTFDAVYHSNVLEHFDRNSGGCFIRECVRVLRPGGTCRIAVPDTEEVCRAYLEQLSGALRGDVEAQARHRWMIVELGDQLARHVPGGEMGAWLRQPEVTAWAFIAKRLGGLARQVPAESQAQEPAGKIQSVGFLRRALSFVARKSGSLRRVGLSFVLTRHEMQALQVGLFRLHGEPHLWLYDSQSLNEAMREAGLGDIERHTATSSRIAGWERYGLDANQDGSEHQAGSLYMEGVRPA